MSSITEGDFQANLLT